MTELKQMKIAMTIFALFMAVLGLAGAIEVTAAALAGGVAVWFIPEEKEV